MAPTNGWIGTLGQVKHALRCAGADKDKDGNILLVNGQVVTFMGMVDDGAEAVVSGECCYLVGGQPRGLAHLLSSTSYGMGVTVIGG